MSNTERQRLFRKRNPGYYGRLHRVRKAEVEAVRVARCAPALALPIRIPLMLPAPVEQLPLFTFDTVERELVPVNQPRETVAPLARPLEPRPQW